MCRVWHGAVVVRESATEKKIRLGEVSSALGVAPKLIRNWTAHEDFDLLGSPDREENKWRQYSYFDVAHLAIASQAIRYGFSISEGHDFAAMALVRVFGPLLTTGLRLATAPALVIEAACRGKDLYLFKLSDGEGRAIMTPMDELPRYPGGLHIDLSFCVGMAFAGLAEVGHDAYADSAPKEYSAEEAEEMERRFRGGEEGGSDGD